MLTDPHDDSVKGSTLSDLLQWPRRAQAQPATSSLPSTNAAHVEQLSDYFSWKSLGLTGGLYIVGISNGYVMTAMLLALTAWATQGRRQAIAAMSLAAMYRFSNGAIASFSPGANVLLWLVAMVASVTLIRGARRPLPAFYWLAAFVLTAALLSIAVSNAPDVSVMKALSFFIISSALVLAAPMLDAKDVQWLQRWLFSLALCVAVLSLLTLPFPVIGMRRTGHSLQGIFSHPQTMGVFFVPFATFFVTRLLVEPIRLLPKWVPALAALFAALIIASDARTAMLATMIGCASAVASALVRGRRGPVQRTRGQLLATLFVLGSLSGGILVSGVLTEDIEAMVLKGNSNRTVTEAFHSSRGGGATSQLKNFADAPLTGFGFGVYRYGVRGGEEGVKRFLGIPISASAEKGVVFTSVLEETGLFGGLLFYGLLISLVAAVARGATTGPLAMLVSCIAVNFGEAIIFATGGMGLFLWIVMGFALARARFTTAQLRETRLEETASMERPARFSFVGDRA